MKILTTIFCLTLFAGALVVSGFWAWMSGEVLGGHGWEIVRIGGLAMAGSGIWIGADRLFRKWKARKRDAISPLTE